jgi:hypothetical protein
MPVWAAEAALLLLPCQRPGGRCSLSSRQARCAAPSLHVPACASGGECAWLTSHIMISLPAAARTVLAAGAARRSSHVSPWGTGSVGSAPRVRPCCRLATCVCVCVCRAAGALHAGAGRRAAPPGRCRHPACMGGHFARGEMGGGGGDPAALCLARAMAVCMLPHACCTACLQDCCPAALKTTPGRSRRYCPAPRRSRPNWHQS